jgi:hypothetical protein
MTRCPSTRRAGLVGALAGGLAAGVALADALVLDVDDGQPQQLDHGVIAREVAAGLGDLAELVDQRLALVGVLWNSQSR